MPCHHHCPCQTFVNLNPYPSLLRWPRASLGVLCTALPLLGLGYQVLRTCVLTTYRCHLTSALGQLLCPLPLPQLLALPPSVAQNTGLVRSTSHLQVPTAPAKPLTHPHFRILRASGVILWVWVILPRRSWDRNTMLSRPKLARHYSYRIGSG